MGNYKSAGLPILTLGGLTRPIPKNLKILDASTPTTTTNDAFQENGVDYQVPTGKTFVCIGFQYIHGAGSSTSTIIYEAAAAAGSDTLKFIFQTGGGINYDEYFFIANAMTFAAEKYISFNPGAANILIFRMLGYEE